MSTSCSVPSISQHLMLESFCSIPLPLTRFRTSAVLELRTRTLLVIVADVGQQSCLQCHISHYVLTGEVLKFQQ